MKKTEYVFLRMFLSAFLVALISLIWLNLSHKLNTLTEHVPAENKTSDAWTGHPQCMTGDSLVLKDINSDEYVCRRNTEKLEKITNI